jgi:hypothetical protein
MPETLVQLDFGTSESISNEIRPRAIDGIANRVMLFSRVNGGRSDGKRQGKAQAVSEAMF